MVWATACAKEKLNRLLQEAAQVSVDLDRADGTITGVPHYSVIECRLTNSDSSSVVKSKPNRWQAGRGADGHSPLPEMPSPFRELNFKKRTMTSIDGPVEVQELQGYCSACRRLFLPRQGNAGV